MNKRKLPLVLHIINSLDDGGAEAILFRLIQSQKEYEHIVISITDDGKYGIFIEKEGSEYMLLHMHGIYAKILGIFKIAKIIRSIHPDVVQTWMYQADLIGGIAAKIEKIENIVWGVHNSVVNYSENKISRFLLIRLNAILSNVIPKKIVSVSFSGADNHVRIGFSKKKIVVINNGYPTDIFSPDFNKRRLIENELNIKKYDIIIGNVARLDPQKDHENLLNSLLILKEDFLKKISFLCILVGKGTDNSSFLFNEIKKRGLESQVLILGQRHDVCNIMNFFDIYVCSSSAEAFPNTICEAMACGIPCVSTDVGDSSYIIDKTGWVVPAKSPEKLAHALFLAITDNFIFDKKIEARNRIVRKFNIKTMSDLYMKTWSSVI